jgi:hypothetical protein
MGAAVPPSLSFDSVKQRARGRGWFASLIAFRAIVSDPLKRPVSELALTRRRLLDMELVSGATTLSWFVVMLRKKREQLELVAEQWWS